MSVSASSIRVLSAVVSSDSEIDPDRVVRILLTLASVVADVPIEELNGPRSLFSLTARTQ